MSFKPETRPTDKKTFSSISTKASCNLDEKFFESVFSSENSTFFPLSTQADDILDPNSKSLMNNKISDITNSKSELNPNQNSLHAEFHHNFSQPYRSGKQDYLH